MDPYRLPRTVLPSRYDLRLEPDLPNARFSGEVVIAVTIQESVTDIVLNAAELQLQQATLEYHLDRRYSATIQLEEANERCWLRFAAPLPPGTAKLHLTFTGILNDKLRGFYRSQYTDSEGTQRYLAVTQFEATDARRAFPCWDEPSFRAVFATTLVVDSAHQVISNTSLRDQRTDERGKKVLRFHDTIPMSTYLVAFVVGDLEGSEPTLVPRSQGGSTPLRVWCVPGKTHLSSFAQDVAAFTLKFFQDYYDRDYPGDKLDLIAIPDFAAGAMENLGAITFRETALLVDEAQATLHERQRIADVVAHENAHMWFGDLVTMSWWNGLWLNEAFATFMEMASVDAYRPQWQRWTAFALSRSAAFTVDGLWSTRPVEFPVEAPEEAEAMFDVLTYEKGASVLRMLEQYLGTEVFRDGVRCYLARHALKNTETIDLWRALADVSGQDIPSIMDAWVFKPGYPVVHAREENGELVVTQQRFTYLPAEGEQEAQLWHIPLQVRFQGTTTRTEKVLLTGNEVRLALREPGEAILVNQGSHGFYRVSYSPELLGRLVAFLPGGLSAVERYTLVNDTWASVLAGLVPLETYLDLVGRFEGERDGNVWAVLIQSFRYLECVIQPEDRPALAQWVRGRVASALKDLGWEPGEGEDELLGQLRGDLLSVAGTLGEDGQIQQQARTLYETAGQGKAGQPLSATIHDAIIRILAHTGDEARYEEFSERLRIANTPQEEQRFRNALAQFRVSALIDRTLKRCLDGDFRTQDAPYLVRALMFQTEARPAAWEFVRTNWASLRQRYPMPGVRRMCEGVSALVSQDWEQQVRVFFAEKGISLGGKTLEQYLERLRIAVRFQEREGELLRRYLHEK